MLGAVEQQHRALAEDLAQQRVGLARAQAVGRRAEDLLDHSGSNTMTKPESNEVEKVTMSP